jgi:hypothetical protein
MSNALRPSELFPLRWRCFDEVKHVLDIQETIYKGKIRPFGKTKGSLAKVPVARVLAEELVEWRSELKKRGKDTSPDAFMFPGRLGGPMDSSNYRNRVLHKLAVELELPKLTFQVIRRTIATLGKTKGHVKDIQGIMRHSKASTTTDIYMQSLEPEVRTAVNSIYDELMGNGTNGAGTQEPRPAYGNPRTGNQSDVAAVVQETQKKSAITISGQAERKPMRGVVLEFATRMRQSRGREGELND